MVVWFGGLVSEMVCGVYGEGGWHLERSRETYLCSWILTRSSSKPGSLFIRWLVSGQESVARSLFRWCWRRGLPVPGRHYSDALGLKPFPAKEPSPEARQLFVSRHASRYCLVAKAATSLAFASLTRCPVTTPAIFSKLPMRTRPGSLGNGAITQRCLSYFA